ncbi:uncharacterized protein CTHT_0021060 [Thermochaetoides thermophila DSM 1495]|uniref:VPS4-associated protein 1 n=1 Tax=Chaetomium thermophilum (strain DSM 1495 / CBS 144.50 / IMI 039719) TaxID=759272 RepID=G0S3H5_CHATD|nr:hypothetical protein CTHT_0021060 [Thermochaetoides thermophila DSM 1495]EGS22558.1 hypothetical protein CTHT_0021060 [Thermochaetoides thermophila DSM 1495]
MSFPNLYVHRKVAESNAKPCDICYKLSSSVLVTDSEGIKDWFHVCPSHLKDRGFCTPKINQAAIEERKQRELQEEIERLKKEYEEKQQKKKKQKDEGKEGKSDSADEKTGNDDNNSKKPADISKDNSEVG